MTMSSLLAFQRKRKEREDLEIRRFQGRKRNAVWELAGFHFGFSCSYKSRRSGLHVKSVRKECSEKRRIYDEYLR